MPGRLSPVHNAAAAGTAAVSVNPASRNGGASNAAVNGAAVDLRGKRGALFILEAGILTGAGNYAAYLQTSDLPADAANGNWSNVNTTTYPNAAVAVKTNANSAFLMTYNPPAGGGLTAVRAVLIPDANIGLIGISHITF